MADAWDDIDWSKWTEYDGTLYSGDLPAGMPDAPFLEDSDLEDLSMVADGTLYQDSPGQPWTTSPTQYRENANAAWTNSPTMYNYFGSGGWNTTAPPANAFEAIARFAGNAVSNAADAIPGAARRFALGPFERFLPPGNNAMLPGAENATPEQILSGQFYPGLPENGSDRYATDSSGAVSGTVTTGIPNLGLEVMPRVVSGSGSGDSRISQPFWEWGGTGQPANNGNRWAGEERYLGTSATPGGGLLEAASPRRPTAGTFTPGGAGIGGSAGGFDSFVPQTAGIAGERSKAFFEQAGRIEIAAGELDLSPLLSAGKQKFDLARQRVNESKTKALGDMNAMFERNRVAGSSLAADRMVLASKEFEKQQRELDVEEATFSAQTKLQEITTKADLMQKASATRVQAYQSQIDDVMKVASLGAQNAQVQAAMQDSANRLYGVLKSLEAQRSQIEMQIQAQEAQSIRNSLTQIDVAGISADTAKRNADIAAAADNARTKLERDQGIGQLFSPITSGLMQGAANWLLGTGPTYGVPGTVQTSPGTQGAISRFFTS